MKKMIFGTVVCLSAMIASAQTMNTVHVNLPVDAKVGKFTLPAGSYSIHELSNSVIQITSDSNKGVSTLASVMQIVAPTKNTSDTTKVVLEKKNDSFQVQKIWLEGQDMGFELTAAE